MTRITIARLLLFLFLLPPAPAKAGETLTFAAQAQSDELAEEAILLLQCLANRSGLPWEFTGEASGAHWLRVKQTGQELAATYHSAGKEEALTFGRGGAQAACDRLEPESAAARLGQEPALPGAGEGAPPEAAHSRRRTWLWVGAGVAAAALGGFLLWKSRKAGSRPETSADYGHIEMR